MSQIALLSRNGSTPKRQEFLKQTVQDFFGTLNWEGIDQPKPAPPSASATSTSEDLFADFAADFGADLETSAGANTETSSDMAPAGFVQPVNVNTTTTSVGTFFSSFPWEGQPIIAGPVQPETPGDILPALEEDPAENLTLDAFSDLF